MQSVVCANCGAPLDVSPAEIQTGFAKCPYCNGTTQVAERVIVETPASAAEAKDRRAVIGRDSQRILLEELDAPASRPANTRLQLTNEPGVSFRVVGPRAFGAGLIIAVIWTGGFGGAFAGIIATLAETHMSPLIVYIVIAAAAVIEGIGLWLAIRSMLRRDEIRAKDGKFLIVARGLNGGRKEYDWSQISSFQFEASGVSSDNRSVSFHILSMNVGGQKVMLWSFFITTTGAEQRWILTELRAFFAPIWQRAAAQSPDHPA